MPLIPASTGKPRVILGLMTFGPPGTEDTGARITEIDEFNKVLDTLQSRGYNELDTARMYIGGKQEAHTAEAGWKKRGITLATKVQYPTQPGMNTSEKVMESVEISLKDLGSDSVDILYLHAADRLTPFSQTLQAIDNLHKAGKFVTFGISNFTSAEVAEIVLTCKYNNWVRPTLYQGMYNAITRGIEPELIPTCRRYGLDIVVYNPIAGGLFSGKIKSADIDPSKLEGRFSNDSKSGGMYRKRYFRDSTFRALKTIEDAVAKHQGLTMIETALRWTVHHSKLKVGGVDKKGGNDGIIIGISSHGQLEGNLENLEKGPLPEDVVAALDEAWGIVKADAPNYWHGEFEYGYDTREALFGKGAK